MRVWPGQPYPARRDLGRGGRQLRPVLRARHQGGTVPVRFARRDEGSASHRTCPSTPTRSGTPTCPTSSPASSTATASTAPTSRQKGHRFNPHKLLLDPYAKAIGRDLHWDDALFGYKIGDPDGRPVVRRARQRALRPAGGRRRHGLHLGRRPAAAHALAQDAHLRAARQGLHQAPSRRAREAARHLRRRGLRGGHPAPAQPGRHRRRTDAGPSPRRRPPPGREGPDATTGATTRWPSSPRTCATPPGTRRGSRCRSSR